MKLRRALVGWLTLLGVVVAACREAEPEARHAAATPAAPSASAPASVPSAAPPAAAASASTSAAPPQPARPSPAQLAAAEKYVASLEAVAKLFSSNAGRCAELAKALANAGSERDALHGASGADAHRVAAGETALASRLDVATAAIADGSMKCDGNKAFRAAQAQLFPDVGRNPR